MIWHTLYRSSFIIYAFLSVAGLGIALACSRTARVRAWRRWLVPVLVALCLLAWGNYFRWGVFRFGSYINPPDVFHYYVGSKYSPELGYTHLYRCALVADHEGRGVYRKNKIRDLDTHRFEPTQAVLDNAGACKGRFSESRWAEFSKDVRYFVSIMPAAKWNRVLRDKGYNATPVWNMVARFLAERFPVDGPLGLGMLLALDPLLLAGAFAVVWAAFGPRVLLWSLLFFGSNFFMSMVHIKNSFLRLDWVALLVAATCLLKSGRYAAAGACVGYASLARVFPAIFAFGMGAKLVWDWRARRRIDRRYVAFFGAMAGIAVAFAALSVVADDGLVLWREFADKIAVHNQDLSTTRVGFKYVLLSVYEFDIHWRTFLRGNDAWFRHTWPPWLLIQTAVLAVGFVAVRRSEDHEALVFGIVPVYFLTAPTFYYYVMLIVPFVWLASRLDEPRYARAAAWLFATSLVGHWLTSNRALGLGQSYVLTCFLGIFVAYLTVLALLQRPTPGAETAT